ncbi:unnamed protein product [Adineta ricciae]|uniref:NAD(P)(+)--arginine ADP-ribosyltransferase n=1 Tax=Adineta ricciae TaxID=249248 RepID=A0A815NC35_ADIRI|nr:unnamed protein product [Adineta ricciae]CAF1473336.1 unnamed protein product [Adineta ricciae]
MPSCSLCSGRFTDVADRVTSNNGLSFHRDCLEQLAGGKSQAKNQQQNGSNISDRGATSSAHSLDSSNPFSPEATAASKYMKPIGHVAKFSKLSSKYKSHDSLDSELLLSQVTLVADPSQLLKQREEFLIYEDNFKSTIAQSIKNRLSYADLYRVCSKYDKKGMAQHDTKSDETMQYFLDKHLSGDDAKACAFAICFYTGSNSGTINRSSSTMARRGNGEATSILEDTEADHASIIMYYLILGLSHINFYWGTTTRAVNMHEADLNEYFEGAIITWIQFSSSMKGDRPAKHFAKRNTIFTMYSLTGRGIQEFSNFPDEEEILFMPHSSFLVTKVQRDSYQNRIFMRQVELGLCQHSVLWVDDHIFDEDWGNKEHMEKAGTLGGEVSVHFIPKSNTEAALAFLNSPFGQRLKGKSNFRIVTDMHRDNEDPPESAGAKLLLEVRKLGFNCPCLVYTSRKEESVQEITNYLNPRQLQNVDVTTSSKKLEKFVSF